MTHVIVVGNEKGGSGKSTTAMHLIASLAKGGVRVGAMDLDVRQRSLTRYLENRALWAKANGRELPMPRLVAARPSQRDSRAAAEAEDGDRFAAALCDLADCEFAVVDCPGGDTNFTRRALLHADTVLTPMNDSFVDFDLLAHLDPDSGEIKGPSIFAEAVWAARKARAAAGARDAIDWVVVRNRLSAHNANNKKRVGERLSKLANRIGFRVGPGVGERVIYRELFPYGLTLVDLGGRGSPLKMSMSHVTARQELRALVRFLNLPSTEAMRERPRAA
ncbi:MAG: division plane positioning ATPase MipZ [Pseudomonadota bacterium]